MSTVLLELSGYLTLNCIDQTLYYRKKLVGFKHSALFVFKPSQPKPSILFLKTKTKTTTTSCRTTIAAAIGQVVSQCISCCTT